MYMLISACEYAVPSEFSLFDTVLNPSLDMYSSFCFLLMLYILNKKETLRVLFFYHFFGFEKSDIV